MGAGRDTTHTQGKGFDDQTVRDIVHLSAGGDAVRIELSDAFGDRGLHIGAASVALRQEGGAIQPGTSHTVTFAGQPAAVIPAGGSLLSDPIDMHVGPGSDLAVSVYLPEPTGPTTWHQHALATSYVSSGGDHTSDATAAAFSPTTSWFFLTQVEVRGARESGAVVALGDSITEGYRSTTDANHRYTDFLNRRMEQQPVGQRLTVINEGIGGNRLLTNSVGAARSHESGQTRFARDVLTRSGVKTVIVLYGTNDLASYGGNADGQPADVADLVHGMQNLLTRAHAHGLRVVVGTIPPFGGSSIYSERTEQVRQDYNTWVRRSGEPDAVADFDAALRDPSDPSYMAADLNSGDHVHPSDAGYRAMAAAVDLRLLEGRGKGHAGPTQSTGYVLVGRMQAPSPLPGGEPSTVTVPVTSALDETADVTVSISTPGGWSERPVSTSLAPGETVEVEIPVTAPQTPTTAALAAAVAVDDALVLGHPTLNVTTAPAPSVSALALDAGGPDSPVLDGYAQLITTTGYTAETGFGWSTSAGLDFRDRGTPGDLRRDFVMSEQADDLRVEVPAGQHQVYVLTGDASYAAGGLVISEGGTQLATTGGKLSAGTFRWLGFTLDGGDSGRVADLSFSASGAGHWHLNALVELR